MSPINAERQTMTEKFRLGTTDQSRGPTRMRVYAN